MLKVAVIVILCISTLFTFDVSSLSVYRLFGVLLYYKLLRKEPDCNWAI